MELRKNFFEIFQQLPDGSLTPKVRIDINGIMFGPGVVFQKGVVFGGVDFHLYKNNDISVEEQTDGTTKILGFYN
ncbi:hypothetical protein HZA75_06925 [Candidatus Roizmanbacteria bacterium]|nr:hypothetical protein [Candidatus Roizmanbacteria bacterium]